MNSELTNKLISAYDLVEQNYSDKLPALNDGFKKASELLRKHQFDIVVCGEVKKGKSSFINALMGQDLLPVDVHIATSQVFRISNSEIERYFLKFIDGSEKEITREELAAYGSQVESNKYGVLQVNNKPVDYIQVLTKLPFLPDEVSIVDTPGLGALYPAHTRITNRYIKKASAAIFVFSADRTLTDSEKGYVNKIIEITPYVIFIMTKVDRAPNTYKKVLSSTEQELNMMFGNKLDSPVKIYPINNETLKEGTLYKEEKDLSDSGFSELKEALTSIIKKTVELSVNKVALKELQQIQKQISCYIDERIAILTDENNQIALKCQQRIENTQKTFSGQWSENRGVRYLELKRRISNKIEEMQNDSKQLFSTTGYLYEKYIQIIKNISSEDEANNLAESLPCMLQDDVLERWRVILNNAEKNINDIIAEGEEEISHTVSVALGGKTAPIEFAPSERRLISHVRNESYTALFVSMAVTCIIGPMGAIPFLGSILYGFFKGKNELRKQELDDKKKYLIGEFNKLFKKWSDEIWINPQTSADGQTTMKNAIDQLEYNAQKAINAIIKKAEEKYMLEIDSIKKLSEMSIAEKRAEKTFYTEQKTIWNRQLCIRMNECAQLIKNIEIQ